MTYVDTTLTPAVTYTYVHNGQIYDQIATTLAAHGAWQYVEYVDSISAPNTFRRHIWRCKSASSGLPADFYVMFQTKFTTATGVYSTIDPVVFMLAEGYSGGVLSKMASLEASITPASDLTNPATWTLTTAAPPASVFFRDNNRYLWCGPTTNSTSVRLIYIVAKDGLLANWGPTSPSSPTSVVTNPVYVGAYDTILGAVADPMPITMFAYTSSSTGAGGCTRAPLQAAGVAVTDVFTMIHHWTPSASSLQIGSASPWATQIQGILGSPATTTWTKSQGGVQVVRGWLSSFTNAQTTNSTKGLLRGNHKYLRCTSTVATHSAGDTFLVDGKVYLGLGAYIYGLWDTTAA